MNKVQQIKARVRAKLCVDLINEELKYGHVFNEKGAIVSKRSLEFLRLGLMELLRLEGWRNEDSD